MQGGRSEEERHTSVTWARSSAYFSQREMTSGTVHALGPASVRVRPTVASLRSAASVIFATSCREKQKDSTDMTFVTWASIKTTLDDWSGQLSSPKCALMRIYWGRESIHRADLST